MQSLDAYVDGAHVKNVASFLPDAYATSNFSAWGGAGYGASLFADALLTRDGEVGLKCDVV